MSKTILASFRTQIYAPGTSGTLVFDVDGLEGDDAIAYVIEQTIDYLAFQAPADGYDYYSEEYGFADLVSLCDGNQDYIDHIAARGIQYLGHDDEVSVSVCASDSVFFGQEDVEEFRMSGGE